MPSTFPPIPLPAAKRRRRRNRVVALVVTCLAVGGGAPAAYATLAEEQSPSAGDARQTAPFMETRLLFGTARPDGGPAVTRAQFRAFVTQVATPRFPEGLTVQEGYGQYRDAHGVIERERSYELVLYYPVAEAEAAEAEIEEIRRAYVVRYGQESVARVDDRIRVDF